jgi:hypothetical protein
MAGDAARRRAALRVAGWAAGLAAVLIAPYLIACWVVFGDPLYAINYHTQFYLDRSGRAAEVISASRYVLDVWRSAPVEALDTALVGLTVYPFTNKWGGMSAWIPGLGTLLMALAAGGLIVCVWTPRWRVLIAVLLGSLVPYMMTWRIVGGSEWRFTLHAYPLYVIAAGAGVTAMVSWGRALVAGWRPSWRPLAWRGGAMMVALILALAWTYGAPYLIARSTLRRGEPAVIGAGERDRLLLTSGWSELSRTGNVTARFNTAARSHVRIPLPAQRAYALELRLDPIPVGAEPVQRVHVFFNDRPVATLQLTWNPDLVGRYTVEIPAALVTPGANDLALQPEYTVDADEVADRYPDVTGEDRVGFRFWYLLVRPGI